LHLQRPIYTKDVICVSCLDLTANFCTALEPQERFHRA
jgi:hypothetical protein